MEDTEWRGEAKGQWRAKDLGASNNETGMSKTRTWSETRCMAEVENGQRHGRRGALVAPCYVWSHFYYPLLIVNLLIYSIKMICTKNSGLAISFGERGPGSIPGETHVEEIIRFLKMGGLCGSNPGPCDR